VSTVATELELPDGLDDRALIGLLGRRLRVHAGRARKGDRVLLDTFDGRLRAAGLRAEWPRGRTAAVPLTLHEPGRPVRRAEVARAAAVGASALPPGPLKERLAPVLEERALLPVARLRSLVVPIAVLNQDDKTVVRLTVERVRAPEGVAARLLVEPVRGYDRELEGAVQRLRDDLGLRAPQRPLFDAAVLAAGGRPEGVSSKVAVALSPGMRADVAAGLVLARLAEIAEANVPGTLGDLDPEFLHDLRVAIRRARSVLRELAGVHAPAPRSRLRDELRWAQELTGPVRDLDVQLLEWEQLSDLLEEGSPGELEPLRELLVARRARELARLRRGLRGRRFAALMEQWRALATEPIAGEDPAEHPRAAVPIEVVAGDRIRSVYRRMVRDGRAIAAGTPDEALHDLRKRGKELRYLLELFGGLFPRAVVRPMVAALKGLQDVLGRFQDRSVQTAQLRAGAGELASAPGGPDALLAVGRLISGLERDQREARDAFAARFAAFAAPEQRALVRATFPKAEQP
jgi:CHAD domain-containing protein